MRMEDKTRMIACMSNVIRIALSIIETIICTARSVAITVERFLTSSIISTRIAPSFV